MVSIACALCFFCFLFSPKGMSPHSRAGICVFGCAIRAYLDASQARTFRSLMYGVFLVLIEIKLSSPLCLCEFKEVLFGLLWGCLMKEVEERFGRGLI